MQRGYLHLIICISCLAHCNLEENEAEVPLLTRNLLHRPSSISHLVCDGLKCNQSSILSSFSLLYLTFLYFKNFMAAGPWSSQKYKFRYNQCLPTISDIFIHYPLGERPRKASLGRSGRALHKLRSLLPPPPSLWWMRGVPWSFPRLVSTHFWN